MFRERAGHHWATNTLIENLIKIWNIFEYLTKKTVLWKVPLLDLEEINILINEDKGTQKDKEQNLNRQALLSFSQFTILSSSRLITHFHSSPLFITPSIKTLTSNHFFMSSLWRLLCYIKLVWIDLNAFLLWIWYVKV